MTNTIHALKQNVSLSRNRYEVTRPLLHLISCCSACCNATLHIPSHLCVPSWEEGRRKRRRSKRVVNGFCLFSTTCVPVRLQECLLSRSGRCRSPHIHLPYTLYRLLHLLLHLPRVYICAGLLLSPIRRTPRRLKPGFTRLVCCPRNPYTLPYGSLR